MDIAIVTDPIKFFTWIEFADRICSSQNQTFQVAEVCTYKCVTDTGQAMEYNAGYLTMTKMTLEWSHTLLGPAVISGAEARHVCNVKNNTLLTIYSQSQFLRFVKADKKFIFGYRHVHTSSNMLHYKQFLFWHINIEMNIYHWNNPWNYDNEAQCKNVIYLKDLIYSKYSRNGYDNVIAQILPDHVLERNEDIFCNIQRWNENENTFTLFLGIF